MKFSKLYKSLVILFIVFISCNDTAKKENLFNKTEAEQLEMEMQAEEEIATAKSRELFEFNSIYTKIKTEKSFKTLSTLIDKTMLYDIIANEGDFTFFAPTNSAFGKISEDTLKKYMRLEGKTEIQNILNYHIVEGVYNSEMLLRSIAENNNSFVINTLLGQNIVLSKKEGTIYIEDANGNKATIIVPDEKVSNGVMHIIDTVITPKI